MAHDNSCKMFLGVDLSTQQVKLIVINEQLQTLYEDGIRFDEDLSEFRTTGGVHLNEKTQSATSPTLMWVKGLDLALQRMKQSGKINFDKIQAISGAGQQHGSVFWRKGGKEILSTMDPKGTIYDHLERENAFTIKDSPVWMDSSTTEECKNLEQTLGGPKIVADLTGSRAYERFTGNQIAKIYKEFPEKYEETERISLVSSFGATLFIGKYAQIDEADGAGMNLMNIKTKKWSQECLNACAPNLCNKLGDIVPSCHIVGYISNYMIDKYGFSSECKVVAFTGDNPASLAGMRLKEGEIIVSLGTSDTLFLWLTEPKPSLEGHVFGNPVDKHAYMALLCYKNGSLLRERIRNECANGKWEEFESLLKNTPEGNNGNIGMYYYVAEITPSNAYGTYRFNDRDEVVRSFEKEVEVRAAIEGQFLAKRVHAENLGLSLTTEGTRILATGGASSSKSILQVLADVFNLPVYVSEISNSASLGSAYRARHSWIGADKISFAESLSNAPEFTCGASPNAKAAQVYNTMVRRYRLLEQTYVRKRNDSK